MIRKSFIFGPFRLVPAERLLLRNNKPIAIGSRALDILVALVDRAGDVVAHRTLLEAAWPDLVVENANLRVHIGNLRKLLSDDQNGARYIANVPGRGYSFVAPLTEATEDILSSRAQPDGVAPRISTSGMIGRDADICAIVDRLRAQRFVSVVGPGGIGKTTTALAAARTMNGIDALFIDLTVTSNDSLVLSAVASALGVTTGAIDPVPMIVSQLSSRPTLLILDNCEHVITAAAELAERLFIGTPGLYLLVTSREALRVTGEQIYWLPPLEAPPEGTPLLPDDLQRWPALALFVDRACSGGHAGALSAVDITTAAAICRRLDGLPLAIELVGSRVGAYGFAGTAELLDNRFRLVWQGRRSALPRHRTLEAMLDWSFNLLDARDRLVMARLSVFTGPFTLEAAQAIAVDDEITADDIACTVASLTDRSLIVTCAGDTHGRFRLLETTRAYAATKLAASSEGPSVARRHVEYVLRLLEGADVEGAMLDNRNLWPLASHMGEIRAALEWSFSQANDPELAVTLAAQAMPLMLSLSLLVECEAWSRWGIALLPEHLLRSRIALSLQQARAVSTMFTHGSTAEVEETIERALTLAQELGSERYELHLLAGLHICQTRIGAFTRSLETARRCIQIAEVTANDESYVIAQWMLGTAYHLVGRQGPAQIHCQWGFERAEQVGVPPLDLFGYDHRIRALLVMARARWLGGFTIRAQTLAARAVSEAEELHRPVSLCIALIYASTVELWNERLEPAKALIERLIADATRYGLTPYAAVGRALEGERLVAAGDPAEGERRLRDELVALRAERHLVLASRLQKSLAEALLKQGRAEEAIVLLELEMAACKSAGGQTIDLPDMLRLRAVAERSLPAPNRTLIAQVLTEAIDHARYQEAIAWELRASIAMAEFLAEEGNAAAAYTLLSELRDRCPGEAMPGDLSQMNFLLTTLDSEPAK